MRQMKDSGIEWIGEIPEGWEVKRIKFLFSERNERCDNNTNLPLLSVSEYYGVAQRKEKIKEEETLVRASSLDGYKICYQHDIVINIMLAWRSSLGESPVQGIVSPSYCVYKPILSNIYSRYYHYLFRTDIYANVFKQYSTGIIDSRLRLYSDKFFSLFVQLPPLAEQQRIADYLDAKCAHIDQCLELTRQSMEKLRAYKLSCITEAVTKGLDPDVPLKDSGVPWIGKICEHYEIIKIKYFTDIIRGKFSHRPRNDPRFYNGEYPFIQTGDIKISNKYIIKYSQTLNDNGFNISRQFPSGTIVMAIAANVGDVAILDFDACFPDSVIGFTNLININKLFFYYTLITLKQVFIEKSTISTQLNLNIEIVNEVKIPYPPLPEQERIAAYLDKKCARIDALLEEKQALLDKLAEYKKSLIFECVTGKREVPSCWNR